MKWLKRVWLIIFIWYMQKMTKQSCLDLAKKMFPDGLTQDELVLIKKLSDLGTPCYEIIEMINKLSVIDDLKDMIRKNFPDLSEEEIEDLINKVRGKINKGNNAKEIFKEDIRPVLDADSTPPGNKV